MKLPNLAGAVIPQQKITEYLLSFAHRDGRHKAAFFTRFGFVADSWDTLAASLLQREGFERVVHVGHGGVGTWRARGHPVETVESAGP